jgi:hypothetical protein
MSKVRVQVASSSTPELFTVMNADWKISEDSSGLYTLEAFDGSAKLGPIDGDKLASALAVISELDRHLGEGR